MVVWWYHCTCKSLKKNQCQPPGKKNQRDHRVRERSLKCPNQNHLGGENNRCQEGTAKILAGENERERQFERKKLCEEDVGRDVGRSTGNRFSQKPTNKDLPDGQDTTFERKNYATPDSCWWSRLRFFSGWILNSNGAVKY